MSARLEPQYPLETERLLLRPFVAEDFEALLAIYSRPEVARYLYSGPMSEDEVRASLERKIGQTAIRAERENLSLAVVLKAPSELIGACTLFYLSSLHRQGEIGFVVHPDHHGRGYATEAARLLLQLAFEELDLHRVIGRLEARNTASAGLLERLGCGRKRDSSRTSLSGRVAERARFRARGPRVAGVPHLIRCG